MELQSALAKCLSPSVAIGTLYSSFLWLTAHINELLERKLKLHESLANKKLLLHIGNNAQHYLKQQINTILQKSLASYIQLYFFLLDVIFFSLIFLWWLEWWILFQILWHVPMLWGEGGGEEIFFMQMANGSYNKKLEKNKWVWHLEIPYIKLMWVEGKIIWCVCSDFQYYGKCWFSSISNHLKIKAWRGNCTKNIKEN